MAEKEELNEDFGKYGRRWQDLLEKQKKRMPEGVWTGHWYREQKEAWMKQIQEVQL